MISPPRHPLPSIEPRPADYENCTRKPFTLRGSRRVVDLEAKKVIAHPDHPLASSEEGKQVNASASLEGGRVAFAGADGKIRIWAWDEEAGTLDEALTIDAGSDPLRAVASVGRDSARLASADERRVCFWAPLEGPDAVAAAVTSAVLPWELQWSVSVQNVDSLSLVRALPSAPDTPPCRFSPPSPHFHSHV